MNLRKVVLAVTIVFSSGACASASEVSPYQPALELDLESMPLVRLVDERYMSFQIGMSHLTGGETWKTYDDKNEQGETSQDETFEAIREVRAPTDLTNQRLRNLTSALAPLYIRYGGTTTNSVFFQDDEGPRIKQPPEGYRWILTRDSWKGALEFADAVDAKVLTGFTVSDGVRDENHAWTPAHAAPFLRYTQSIGGEIYAAELYNEPNAREPGRTEKGESAEAFARDFALFRSFMDKASPNTKLGAPGVAELGTPVPVASLQAVTPEQYMSAEPRVEADLITYHFYGAVSERCIPSSSPSGVSAEQALTQEWLQRPDRTFQRYKALRDQFAPDAPIWLTETGTAACGGTRWQPTFLETFRFLDTHARLAKQGLDAIFTHALISGSNGVIDEKTLVPNANYWAALLWRRLMGVEVLDTGVQQSGLHTYAHCQRDGSGSAVILAINYQPVSTTINIPGAAEIYSLTAPELQSRTVLLNGQPLQVNADDTLPDITGKRLSSERIELAPTSINFVVVTKPTNKSCLAAL